MKAPDEPEPTVLVEKIDGLHIMTIGINRPDKRNCVDTLTAEHLKMAFNVRLIGKNLNSIIVYPGF